MKKIIFRFIGAVSVFIALAHPAVSAVSLSLPAVFSDGMVLQQGVENPVWGTASPGVEVSVFYQGQQKLARADGNTGTLQWLVEQGGQWYIGANTYAVNSQGGSTSYATYSANISTLTWKLFTPFSGGTAVIGADATPTLNNVTAVGYYADVSTDGVKTFAGSESNFFQVQAIPEPATVGMLGLGALITLLFRRMRS